MESAISQSIVGKFITLLHISSGVHLNSNMSSYFKSKPVSLCPSPNFAAKQSRVNKLAHILEYIPLINSIRYQNGEIPTNLKTLIKENNFLNEHNEKLKQELKLKDDIISTYHDKLMGVYANYDNLMKEMLAIQLSSSSLKAELQSSNDKIKSLQSQLINRKKDIKELNTKIKCSTTSNQFSLKDKEELIMKFMGTIHTLNNKIDEQNKRLESTQSQLYMLRKENERKSVLTERDCNHEYKESMQAVRTLSSIILSNKPNGADIAQKIMQSTTLNTPKMLFDYAGGCDENHFDSNSNTAYLKNEINRLNTIISELHAEKQVSIKKASTSDRECIKQPHSGKKRNTQNIALLRIAEIQAIAMENSLKKEMQDCTRLDNKFMSMLI